MISDAQFQELLAAYEKHGWQLRMLVLEDVRQAPEGLSRDVSVNNGIVNAAWFSRPPSSGPNAWEIRSLGGTQYALVEHLDEEAPDFEQRLQQTEQRLAAALESKRTA